MHLQKDRHTHTHTHRHTHRQTDTETDRDTHTHWLTDRHTHTDKAPDCSMAADSHLVTLKIQYYVGRAWYWIVYLPNSSWSLHLLSNYWDARFSKLWLHWPVCKNHKFCLPLSHFVLQVYAEFKRITGVESISTFLSAVDERAGGLIYLYCSRAHTPVKTNWRSCWRALMTR